MLVLCLALAAVLAAGGATLALNWARNGRAVTAVRTLTSDTGFETYSHDPIDVAGMKLFVSVPKDQRAILVITYSADGWCQPPSDASARCYVTVTVDGQNAYPGPVTWSLGIRGEAFDEEVHSMQWVAGPLGPGDHQVKVRAYVASVGSIHLEHQTLTVLRSRY
jgi:hypothetical protein